MVGGGNDDRGAYLDSTEILLSGGGWVAGTPLPGPRFEPDFVSMDNRLFVTGISLPTFSCLTVNIQVDMVDTVAMRDKRFWSWLMRNGRILVKYRRGDTGMQLWE